MKKTIMIFAATLITAATSAQNNTAAKTEILKDPRYIAFKKQHEDLVKGNVVSEYFGYDAELRSFFTNNVIPAALPKGSNYVTREDYRTAVNQWLTENKNLLKPENKNSLLN